MSYVTAKMHHNRFLRGLFPDPAIASLQRSPDPVAGDIRGPTSKPPIKNFWRRHCRFCILRVKMSATCLLAVARTLDLRLRRRVSPRYQGMLRAG